MNELQEILMITNNSSIITIIGQQDGEDGIDKDKGFVNMLEELCMSNLSCSARTLARERYEDGWYETHKVS